VRCAILTLLVVIVGAGDSLLVRAADVRGAAELKVGFAESDITPALGLEQPGGYGKAFHTTFHDPCKVRAAVFDDGRSRVALVGVDALILPRQLVESARARIRETSGIPSECVLVGASHSHSSGPTGMVQPGEYDDASPEVQRLAYQRSSCANADYLDLVQARIVEAVVKAAKSAVPAQCGFGVGREDQVAFNRRLRMRNGETWSHPGKGNPQTLGYAGPVDPDVGVIGAWDASGRLLGCIVNFSCHATTNPGGISANWIYYLEKTIRGALGTQAPVVFLQGACGDVTQVDNLSRFDNPSSEAWCQLVGGRVGAEAVKVLLSVPRAGSLSLDARATTIPVKRRLPSAQRLEAAWSTVHRDNTNSTEWIFAKEIVLLDALARKSPTVEVEVQTVQVGPAVFIATPAEYFVQFGLALKKGSAFSFTFPVELANGCVGYVPTEEAFSASGGGYETRLTSYSNLELAAGRLMLEAGLGLARSLKPGPAPQPAPAPPFTSPWSYGNVPPEAN
jgi:neutral ceramidase